MAAEPPFTRTRMVVGFADLTGFAAGCRERDNLAVAAALQRHYERVAALVSGGGGRVVKFIGDAVLFCFPEGQETAALACARRMVADVPQGIACDLGCAEMRLGVSLHAGEVAAGEFGPAGRTAFDIIGDAVNIAALVRRGPGIAVTEAVRAALGPGVAAQSAEPLRRAGYEVAVFTLS